MRKNHTAIGIATKLTEEYLLAIGFKRIVDKKSYPSKKYRLMVPYYPFQIQVTLGNYPKNNGNCGIVYIYHPEEIVDSYTTKGRKTAVKFKELEQPIAYYVDTPERLRNIIISLTTSNI